MGGVEGGGDGVSEEQPGVDHEEEMRGHAYQATVGSVNIYENHLQHLLNDSFCPPDSHKLILH